MWLCAKLIGLVNTAKVHSTGLTQYAARNGVAAAALDTIARAQAHFGTTATIHVFGKSVFSPALASQHTGQ
jgi:hypothetical protein